jgi:oligopeptide transport system substrate-binding protein
VKTYEWVQLMDRIERGESSFFRSGWIADYAGPDAFLTIFHSRNFPDGGFPWENSTRFADERFDSLFTEARRTAGAEARSAIYRRAEQIAMEEAPIIPLLHDLEYLLLQPYIRGPFPNTYEQTDFAEIWLAR